VEKEEEEYVHLNIDGRREWEEEEEIN